MKLRIIINIQHGAANAKPSEKPRLPSPGRSVGMCSVFGSIRCSMFCLDEACARRSQDPKVRDGGTGE